MQTEEAALAVLDAQPRLTWTGSNRIVFRASAGEIVLVKH
jgi:hypothetical protein